MQHTSMQPASMQNAAPQKDPRVQATAAIWGISVGMLGVCIPLVAVTESGMFLPLLVIVGASISTIMVWDKPGRRTQREQQLIKTVMQLEARVRDLETICSSLDLDAQPPTLSAAAKEIQRSL